MHYCFLLVLSFFLLEGCHQSENQQIKPKNKHLQYEGRVDTLNHNVARIFWPGTSIKLKFRGKRVAACMQDNTGNTYYNLIINGERAGIIRPDTTKAHIELAELTYGVHTLELFRRTEFTTGTTSFYGFKIDSDAEILPLTDKKHKIVFYGNSITTGYANEDNSGQDRPDSIFTNNYLSYAAITARHFNAAYHCIARGGIGFMVSWYPQIMPELYSRLNPNDAASTWRFPEHASSLVVVNLGQNDSWILANPQTEAYQYCFGDSLITKKHIVKSYQHFIQKLRMHYPNTPVICTLGSMDAVAPNSPWPAYIREAVERLNDDDVYVYFFDCLAPEGHPGVEAHQQMAETLIDYIEKHDLLK